MPLLDFAVIAGQLPDSWKSKCLGRWVIIDGEVKRYSSQPRVKKPFTD